MGGWSGACEWPDRESPIVALSGDGSKDRMNKHVFGEYCLYRVSKEQKSGKWQPESEMGIWLGHSAHSHGSHDVAPIAWNAGQQCFNLGHAVTAVTVKVYDGVFPLRRGPPQGKYGSQKFEDFIDMVFEPLIQTSQVESDNEYSDEGSNDYEPVYEVETTVDSKLVQGARHYKIKRVGYNNRYNVWKPEDELDCSELIEAYQQAKADRERSISRRSDRLKAQHMMGIMAYMVTSGANLLCS